MDSSLKEPVMQKAKSWHDVFTKYKSSNKLQLIGYANIYIKFSDTTHPHTTHSPPYMNVKKPKILTDL